jgi:hypothetical protein
MKLHAHEWPMAVSDSFVGAIVSVSEPRFPAVRQSDSDRITVVLGGEMTAMILLRYRADSGSDGEISACKCLPRQRGLAPDGRDKAQRSADLSAWLFANEQSSRAHLGISRSVRNQHTIKSLIKQVVIPMVPGRPSTPWQVDYE